MVLFDEIKDDKYSSLWTWYLNCIRNGEFEELLKEEDKYRSILNKIRETLQTHARNIEMEEEDANISDGNILFLSLHYTLDKDKEIIDDFLVDNFPNVDLSNIVIREICNNNINSEHFKKDHETYYMVIDSLNKLLTTSIEEVSVSCHRDDTSNIDRYKEQNSEFEYVNQSTQAKDLDEEGSYVSSSENDSGLSIELNFKTKFNRNKFQNSTTEIAKAEANHAVVKPSNNASIYSRSDIESIDSYSDLNSRNLNTHYDGQSLKLTHHKDNLLKNTTSSLDSGQNDKAVERLDDEATSDSMIVSDVFSSGAYSMSNLSINSQDRLLSLLPSIEMQNSYGEFKLVLQSMILINFESGESFTAVRQSNSLIHEATEDDEWLLYDSKFSMDNLEIVTLNYLMDIYADFVKIFFYSMVIINLEYPQAITFATDKHINNNLINSDGSSANLSLDSNISPLASNFLSVNDKEVAVSVRNPLLPYIPNSDDNQHNNNNKTTFEKPSSNRDDEDSDCDSVLEYPIPEIFSPDTIASNKATALRSVTTNNSESTYKVLSRTYTGDKSIGRNTTVTDGGDNNNETLLKLLTITPTNHFDTDLSKYSTTLTTMTTVERSISQKSSTNNDKQKSSSKSSIKSKSKQGHFDNKADTVVNNLKGIKQQIHKQGHASKTKSSQLKDSKCVLM
ncbi:hypothetical protein TPHA_0K00540 [Tetrapisispora phaffii CBS 4417]|uniref:Uncharacterized protein n=1 Tax=Tetrapisispora phaffii (strain ATCC 24235 / CBS 4417 / NBRC 1672 / NRRL Y-8282 / UCD 70-5) TaxID=1071381 RepID=G8BZ60_TETPH|nr:hypothetical protein TPHA_0K00540 [Tetrapisispora phaffii CBS 4417]CCE65188.1 hypothetical protein TPHA_0K00540 [Tetrapisispora phaffii CBS 4417]